MIETNRFGQPIYTQDREYVIFLSSMRRRHYILHGIALLFLYLCLGMTPLLDYRHWVLPPSEELKIFCQNGKIEITALSTDSNRTVVKLERSLKCGRYSRLYHQAVQFKMNFVFHRDVSWFDATGNLTESILIREYSEYPESTTSVVWYYGRVYDMSPSYGTLELVDSMKHKLDEHDISVIPLELYNWRETIYLQAMIGLLKLALTFFLFACILMVHFCYHIIKSTS